MLHYERFIATCYTKTNIIILIVFNIVYMLLNLLLVFHSNLSLSNTIYRQSHKSFFSKSDLLFICMLKPRNFDIEKQNLEIDAAKVFFFFNGNSTTKTVFLCINLFRALRIKLHQSNPQCGNRHIFFKLLSIILAAYILPINFSKSYYLNARP